jgi:Zn-dependent M28 family amino/carboxypeptidase
MTRPLSPSLPKFVLLSSLVLAGCESAPKATPQLAPQSPPAVAAAPEAPKSAPTAAEERIIRGTVNPYGFQPKDMTVAVDARTANLRQLFEDLGPDAIEWYQHVQTLSNPWFEGRAPGTGGHDRAVDYLEWWMAQIGLEPAFGSPPSFRQPFELSGRERKVEVARLVFDGKELAAGSDFAVLAMSGEGEVTAPVAFAGYAITEGPDGYTSFTETSADDVQGRVVIFFRYEPLDVEGESRWTGRGFSPASAVGPKIRRLAELGAAAIVMVNPPGAKAAKDGLEDLRSSRFGDPVGVPVVQVTPAVADAWVRSLDAEGRDLVTLRGLGDEGSIKTVAFAADRPVTVAAKVADGKVPAANVGGILRGRGPLADEWLVIGGHFDHVGYGLFGTDPANRGKLHPGADDNASGTAALLVLARRLQEEYAAAPPDANLRSVLFLGFSAEESGLDGSRHWVRNPSLPADRITAMLNLDMMGRLRSDDLNVGGVGSAEGFEAKLAPHFAASGLTVRADPNGRGPSDHASFYGAGVPVLFFFTGTHDLYHTPGDRAHTVNPAGALAVLDLVERISLDLVDDAERLKFVSTDGARTPDRGYAAVRLGVRPGMGEGDETGVLVEDVSAGTSAADAGIRKGDVLLAWDGKELTGAADMMARLREHQPGDQVKIVLRRDGKEETVTVTLKASQPRE